MSTSPAAPSTEPAAPAAYPVGSSPQPAVVVDVWADVVCPWCYLAKRRLRLAIDAWDRPHEVLLRHRAFELDPAAPVSRRGHGLTVAAYLGEKYGGGEEAGRAMSSRVAEIAAQDGLRMDLDAAVHANSFDAHRLVALAREMGGPALEDAALERMFSAHFAEGLAIDDHDVLLRCAAEAGLDERRVAAVLADDTYAEHVHADESEAREIGVTGVPFAVANNRLSVGGAQSVEVYLALLRQAARPA
ncbi:DsbA family oxidoreductase [Lapillicoccus sp.]|uniref:DsbA family oxidoreductase n=1 Tax=Lapillicoccus sp. TaxID=1909287 RepID=UPI0032641E8D